MARPGSALALICCSAFLWGCGLKTPVVPPDAAAPDRIRDLSAIQDETGITLRWSAPVRSRSGEKLPAPANDFRIMRAESSPGGFCPGCPLRFTEAARVRTGPQASPSWRDPDLAYGRIYSYQVIAENGPFNRSLPSNRADAAWDAPPPAPAPPELSAGDHMVTVRIEAEAGYGFELEKRTGAGFAVILRHPAPGRAEYTDREPANGEEAAYRLRLLKPAGASGLFVRGPASKTVAATPRDLTPPPAVTGLTAVETAEGINLFWTPVNAPDLAGYRIIRETTGGKSARIGETGSGASHFVDHAPPAGAQRWRYRVDAVDKAGNLAPGPWAEFERVE